MINKAILVGRLGKDPEVRTAASGKQFCNFTLATDTGFGDKKQTDWHNIVVFDKMAENCGRFLKKGSLVYVEGRISYDKYKDKDGNDRTMTRIIANSVQFLDTRNSQGGSGNFGASYDQGFDQSRSSGYNGGNNYGAPNNYNNNNYGGGNYNNAAPAAPAPDFGIADDNDIPF